MKDVSIGVDIEDICRFKDLSKNNPLLKRIFTVKELNYCFSKINSAPHLAVRYCVKEAVIKALSCLKIPRINYREIEVLNNKFNVPVVKIKNKIIRNLKIKASLSHCGDKAIAFVLCFISERLKQCKK